MIAALVEQVAIWTDDSTLNPVIWSNTNGTPTTTIHNHSKHLLNVQLELITPPFLLCVVKALS